MTEPLVPTEDMLQSLMTVPLDRLVDQLAVNATTIAEVRGVAVILFQFYPSDPENAWPFPVYFAGRPEELRRLGRIVNAIAHRAARLAEGRS